MKADNIVKFQFLSKSCNEAFARLAIASIAAQVDPTLEEINEIKTAVSEAVTNSIVHGYKEKIGIIYITAKLYPNGKLVTTIKDKGCGIEDIDAALTPMFTTGDQAERSGMGFTIMETFMDKVRVRSAPGRGTTVTLEKTLLQKEQKV